MTSLNGKWSLTGVSNLEPYLIAINAPEAHKAKLLGLGAAVSANPDAKIFVQEIIVDKSAGTVQFVFYIKGEKGHDSGVVALGKEVEQLGADGRTAKVTVTLEGESKIVMVKKGSDYEANISLASSNADELTTTMVSGGKTATEKYKRVS